MKVLIFHYLSLACQNKMRKYWMDRVRWTLMKNQEGKLYWVEFVNSQRGIWELNLVWSFWVYGYWIGFVSFSWTHDSHQMLIWICFDNRPGVNWKKGREIVSVVCFACIQYILFEFLNVLRLVLQLEGRELIHYQTRFRSIGTYLFMSIHLYSWASEKQETQRRARKLTLSLKRFIVAIVWVLNYGYKHYWLVIINEIDLV